jgi:hypothetical protein
MSTMHNNDSPEQSTTAVAMERQDFAAFEFAEPPISSSDTDDDKKTYPKGLALVTIVFALCLAVFCVALDNTV